jgi:hypothetical protein
MMILAENHALVPLTVYATENGTGAIKTDVVSGTVRVYSVDDGESEILEAQPLVQVSTGKWRYEWEPEALPIGEYTAEFILTDASAVTTHVSEDLTVKDIATGTALTAAASDISLIKQINAGRWKVDTVANHMVFYDTDGTTPILTVNLFDEDGAPTYRNVMERVPV